MLLDPLSVKTSSSQNRVCTGYHPRNEGKYLEVSPDVFLKKKHFIKFDIVSPKIDIYLIILKIKNNLIIFKFYTFNFLISSKSFLWDINPCSCGFNYRITKIIKIAHFFMELSLIYLH